MKIGIPVTGGKLAMHFGHCEEFAFLTIDKANKTVTSLEMLKPPPHEPGSMPRWTAEQGADLVIGGGMGQRAKDLFEQQGIEVIVGAPSDEPRNIALAWLNGTLQTENNACDH